MTDDEMRTVIAEQIVQDAEIIERLRIKLANLEMAAEELGFHKSPIWLTALKAV